MCCFFLFPLRNCSVPGLSLDHAQHSLSRLPVSKGHCQGSRRTSGALVSLSLDPWLCAEGPWTLVLKPHLAGGPKEELIENLGFLSPYSLFWDPVFRRHPKWSSCSFESRKASFFFRLYCSCSCGQFPLKAGHCGSSLPSPLSQGSSSADRCVNTDVSETANPELSLFRGFFGCFFTTSHRTI